MKVEISEAMLESIWAKVHEYEKDHFGQRCGEDFATFAEVLRHNRRFMSLGTALTLIGSFEMSTIGREMQGLGDSDRAVIAESLMDKPTGVHNGMAEVFYVGYLLGKQVAEVQKLEEMDAK